LVEAVSEAAETSVASAVLALPRREPTGARVVALSYSGTAPTGRLGRIGLRLTELGSETLGSLQRLSDERELLFRDNTGFVAWAEKGGDVVDVMPSECITFLQRHLSGPVEGFAVTPGFALAWSAWRSVEALIGEEEALARTAGP
jgi:hypothetical protein